MKLLVTLILLLLTVGRIDATTPNTGKVPDFCVKVEFDGVLNVESKGGWHLYEKEDGFELHADGSIVIKIYNYQYKDGDELNGFSWALTKGDAKVVSFTVKHGTTVAAYGNEFITSDRKEISNVVWCIELLPPINEEEPPVVEPPVDEEPPVNPEPPVVKPPVEEPPVEEPPVDEPDDDVEVTDPPEVCHDCGLDDEDEIFVPIDEDDDTEPLPETADSSASLFMILLMLVGGALMMTQKK